MSCARLSEIYNKIVLIYPCISSPWPSTWQRVGAQYTLADLYLHAIYNASRVKRMQISERSIPSTNVKVYFWNMMAQGAVRVEESSSPGKGSGDMGGVPRLVAENHRRLSNRYLTSVNGGPVSWRR